MKISKGRKPRKPWKKWPLLAEEAMRSVWAQDIAHRIEQVLLAVGVDDLTIEMNYLRGFFFKIEVCASSGGELLPGISSLSYQYTVFGGKARKIGDETVIGRNVVHVVPVSGSRLSRARVALASLGYKRVVGLGWEKDLGALGEEILKLARALEKKDR